MTREDTLNDYTETFTMTDDDGVSLSEEHTLPLAAMARLRRRPGPVVTNLSTSGSELPPTLGRDAGPLDVDAVVARGQPANGVVTGPAGQTVKYADVLEAASALPVPGRSARSTWVLFSKWAANLSQERIA